MRRDHGSNRTNLRYYGRGKQRVATNAPTMKNLPQWGTGRRLSCWLKMLPAPPQSGDTNATGRRNSEKITHAAAPSVTYMESRSINEYAATFSGYELGAYGPPARPKLRLSQP